MQSSYYIAVRPNDPEIPALSPDDTTADRPYGYKKLSFTSPLVFRNGFRDEFVRRGIQENITDVLFDGNDLLVRNHIRESIERFGFSNLQFYPAIYIDNAGRWHEDYWFLNVHEDLPCLDVLKSKLEPPEDINDPYDTYDVERYVLDEGVLRGTPASARLIFKLYRVSLGYVFLDKKIVDIFMGLGVTGIRYFDINSFEEGDQYS